MTSFTNVSYLDHKNIMFHHKKLHFCKNFSFSLLSIIFFPSWVCKDKKLHILLTFFLSFFDFFPLIFYFSTIFFSRFFIIRKSDAKKACNFVCLHLGQVSAAAWHQHFFRREEMILCAPFCTDVDILVNFSPWRK